MSDTHYRPTYPFAKEAYNATQVRLYGIYQDLAAGTKLGDISITPSTTMAKGKGSKVEKDKKGGIIRIGSGEAGIGIFVADNSKGSIGIIYGYAYEGHCYDLPRPAIMLLPVPASEIPKDDSAYFAKRDEGYRVWVLDKLEECQQIEVTSGFVEELVLQANMPGKRSPSSYRATMQMAHRNGRLTEERFLPRMDGVPRKLMRGWFS